MSDKEKLWDNATFKSPNMEKFSKNIESIKKKNEEYSRMIRKNRTISVTTLLRRFTI
jgi:hypothetical protein